MAKETQLWAYIILALAIGALIGTTLTGMVGNNITGKWWFFPSWNTTTPNLTVPNVTIPEANQSQYYPTPSNKSDWIGPGDTAGEFSRIVLKVGESVYGMHKIKESVGNLIKITYESKHIVLKEVGSDGSIYVEVSGESYVIALGMTLIINDVRIKNSQVFYPHGAIIETDLTYIYSVDH